MTNSNGVTVSKMAVVLIPVIVGSLLGLTVSLTTNFFTFRHEHDETLRKERAAHLERAMTLAGKYSTDVGKLLSIGFITKGNVTPSDLAILNAPTDTLQELRIVILLYFPHLKSEFDQILKAHQAMMLRLDPIIDANDQHRGEDAAAFTKRIATEIGPTMERVRNLMEELVKLSDPASQKRSSLAYSQHA